MAHSNRNNILYVVLEDFSPLASASFGMQYGLEASALKTPNLDRLASQATTFQHAYCQAPICNPSRTSFLTSRRPEATHCYTNDDLRFPQLPTLTDFVKASAPHATVACGGGGKIFHIACDKEERGFVNGAAQLRGDEAMLKAANQRLERGLNRSWSGGGSGGSGHGGWQPVHSPNWAALTSTLYGQPPTGRTNDQEKTRVAVRLLAHYARTRERYFLAVGLSSTHVQGSSICMPGAYQAENAQPLPTSYPLAPARSFDADPPLLTWPNWDLTRFDIGWRWQREALGRYYGCATHMDTQIGALLDALDVLQLAQSTAVIVQGDHGFSLGRHGRWSKYNLYEDSTRVPLLIAVPGGRVRVVDDVVESLDVMPTILDLWGVRRLHTASAVQLQQQSARTHFELNGAAIPLDGESLVPYLLTPSGEPLPPATVTTSRGGSSPHMAPVARRNPYARSELREWMMIHRPTDTELPGARPVRMVGKGAQLYVRTPSHSYVAYLRPRCGCGPLMLLDETLYDVRSDPGESYNLAYRHSHAETRRALLGEVLTHWRIDGATLGLVSADRATRVAMVDELARCFNASVRCHTVLGEL